MRLLITPRAAGPAGEAASLTIVRVEGTPLLAEDPAVPWPGGVAVRAGGDVREIRLGIRPARCDPHAVAEDKVGTLLPLRVTVGRAGRTPEGRRRAAAPRTDLRFCHRGLRTPVVCWHVTRGQSYGLQRRQHSGNRPANPRRRGASDDCPGRPPGPPAGGGALRRAA